MLFFLIWYSINIFMAPILISKSEGVNLNAIHPAGRVSLLSSPQLRCDHGIHPAGRMPPAASRPFRIDKQKVGHKIPYILSSKVTNRAAHAVNGNQASRGKPITLCYWNKGSSFLLNKQEDISDIINTYKPLVLGLGEAQYKKDHSLAEVQQPGFTLHLDSCQDSLGVSRCAVYTHNSLVVKRRDDLEDKGIATVWLQLGLPHQKGILVMCGYRQWRLPGQPDGGTASGTVPAQRERWARILSQWEKALSESREVICLMDANIDALTWTCEDLPAGHSNVKLKPLIQDLFDKILPHGVTQLVQAPTHAQFGMATKCLDHLYSTNPEKLSNLVTEFTGMSDHKLIKVQRFSKSLKKCPRYVKKKVLQKF